MRHLLDYFLFTFPVPLSGIGVSLESYLLQIYNRKKIMYFSRKEVYLELNMGEKWENFKSLYLDLESKKRQCNLILL